MGSDGERELTDFLYLLPARMILLETLRNSVHFIPRWEERGGIGEGRGEG